MNADELTQQVKKLIPSKEVSKKTKVVVARKKKRGGLDVYPCVVDMTTLNIPLPGMSDPVLAIVFES